MWIDYVNTTLGDIVDDDAVLTHDDIGNAIPRIIVTFLNNNGNEESFKYPNSDGIYFNDNLQIYNWITSGNFTLPIPDDNSSVASIPTVPRIKISYWNGSQSESFMVPDSDNQTFGSNEECLNYLISFFASEGGQTGNTVTSSSSSPASTETTSQIQYTTNVPANSALNVINPLAAPVKNADGSTASSVNWTPILIASAVVLGLFWYLAD